MTPERMFSIANFSGNSGWFRAEAFLGGNATVD